MKNNNVAKSVRHFASLKQIDADFTGDFASAEDCADARTSNLHHLKAYQEAIFANKSSAILIILQGMDTSGKDGVIKHIFTGTNPQGVDVSSFKAPNHEECDHDFLWRFHKLVPARGRIAIFNRSYYEETTVVRVHPEFLRAQNIAIGDNLDTIFNQRFVHINRFEKYLVQSNILVLKFFLHISKDEQKARINKRLQNRHKQWKFDFSDVAEREHWDQYMHCYDQVLAKTHTTWAPWHVIPANHKWFARYAVSKVIADHMAKLDLSIPRPSKNQISDMAKAIFLLDQDQAIANHAETQ